MSLRSPSREPMVKSIVQPPAATPMTTESILCLSCSQSVQKLGSGGSACPFLHSIGFQHRATCAVDSTYAWLRYSQLCYGVRHFYLSFPSLSSFTGNRLTSILKALPTNLWLPSPLLFTGSPSNKSCTSKFVLTFACCRIHTDAGRKDSGACLNGTRLHILHTQHYF